MTRFDDHSFWKERHKKEVGKVAAVAFPTYSETANEYIYKILIEQYKSLLQQLDLPKDCEVLDAGSGIGIFAEFLHSMGFRVTAVDISDTALSQIKTPAISRIVSPLNKLPFKERSFEAVHSFDVLYHIVDNAEWEESLTTLCNVSRKYLILHERFMRHKPLITVNYINMRPYQETRRILDSRGFREVMSTPTHAIALRLWSYEISKYFPKVFYHLDRAILGSIRDSAFQRLGSHHIKVFERIE